MGRVIRWILIMTLSSIQSNVYASNLVSQADRDIIREFYIENILNVKPTMVNLSSDLRMMRYTLNKNSIAHIRSYPPIHEVPLVRIFSRKELTLGNLVKLAGLSSNFEVVIHPSVNQNEPIDINQNFNSLTDIALYLNHVSAAEVGIANESRMILVMPSISRTRIIQNVGM